MKESLSRFYSVWLLAAVVLLTGCAVERVETSPQPSLQNTVQVVRSLNGAVVSDSPAASKIGAEMLAQGGNAVDAATATAFALAVAWPEAGNLGGGGFMLVLEPGGDRPDAIDYRETAPAAATADMYVPGENRHHARHVGVPGTVSGLAEAHRRYGQLPWQRVVAPAAQLARDGFVVDEYLARSINRVMEQLDDDDAAQVAELKRIYGKPDGTPWHAGDRLVLPELAATLDTIAADGPETFYKGAIAENFAVGMQRLGGIITTQDLEAYQTKHREATLTRYRGYDVYGMPPPSSGGVSVGLMLQMLEPFDLRDHPRDGVRNRHLIAEVMRRAFHQRALHLGDTDFVTVPAELLQGDPAFARQLAATIDPDRATPSTVLTPRIKLANEPPSTTHFSVVDADGMAVSNTTTLEQSWGSRVILPGLGFVLNNEMGDFNWVEGRTTTGGAIGTAANVIAPGKRMLSSMSPTIVAKDGRAVLVTGSPGGRTIINTVLGIVLDVCEYGLSVEQAVQNPRMHHAWLPDVLRLEAGGREGELDELASDLRAMGHEVEVRNGPQGSAHTIYFNATTGQTISVADYRRGGRAVAAD